MGSIFSISRLQNARASGNITGGTPLMVACMNGNINRVRYLVEEAKVDVNERGSIRISNHNQTTKLTDSTALHAAVIAGQIDVVRYLTDNSQTNINATTGLSSAIVVEEGANALTCFNTRYLFYGSTALHLAVLHLYDTYRTQKTQSEILSCLLEHGADWTINDNAGKQCWELTENVDLTKLLLEYGVGLHSTHNSTSSNILHRWANSLNQRASEVIALAIEKGVDVDEPNANGLTPIMIAAIGEYAQPNLRIFEQILNQDVPPISRLNRINAMELVGAALIFSAIQLETGFEYWRKAMELRFEVSDEPFIVKSRVTLPDVARIAFKDVREVETKEELDNLWAMDRNRTSLEVQAQLIYVRILGLNNDETLRQLYAYAVQKLFTDKEDFLNYSNLILQSCDLKKSHFHYFEQSLQRSISVLERPSSIYSDTVQILEHILVRLQRTGGNRKFNDFILKAIVKFTYVLLAKPLTKQESSKFKNFLRRAIFMQKQDYYGHDLFLLAVTFTFRFQYLMSERDDSLFKKVMSVLLECGADPNSKNADNETAIHILTRSKDLIPAIRFFYEAGTHLDQINRKGKTMADLLSENKVPFSLTGIPKDEIYLPPLTCLSARILNRCCIVPAVFLKIPNRLVDFIKSH